MDARMNLSDEENELYTKLFVQCDLDGFGYVSGETTCDLFRKSGLSDDVLFSIWEIADKKNSGQLDFSSFCVCLRLIGHVQVYGPHALRDSDVLMNKTPEELPVFTGSGPSGYSALNSMSNYDVDPVLYMISSADYDGYKYTFLQLTPDVGDYLVGEDARNFYFDTTSLSQDELMHLWTLADFDKDGRLNLREFCVMQKLCECLKMYGTMPRALPEPLLEFLESGNEGEFLSGQTDNFGPTDVDPNYLPPGLEPNLGPTSTGPNLGPPIAEKGVRSEAYAANRSTDHPSGPVEAPPQITNALVVQCENMLNTLRDAINAEKSALAVSTREAAEVEAKLKSDTKTLENLLAQYRSLAGEGQNMSKRRTLLNQKLSIIQDQIQEMRDQIQTVRVSNVAMSSNIDKNNEEQSLLQNTRQMFLKQLEEDTNLLKSEERELGEMSNTLQQLRRQKDLLLEKNNQLKECLAQSENATKTMLRSIQLQQGKIMSVRNERINLLEEKLRLSNEINRLNISENNLSSTSQNTLSAFRDTASVSDYSTRGNVNRNLNFDKKGIRVSSVSVKVGDDFPQ